MTTTSANPDLLQQFLDEVRPARHASQQTRASLSRTQVYVRQNSPDYGVDVDSLSALSRRFEAMRDNERFVSTIRTELLRADRNAAGTATISDAAVSDALADAGVGTPPPAIEFEAATLTGLPPTSGFVDDPICAANGNMIHQDLDVVFPGVAGALDVRRTYNSLLTDRPGAFGPGWASMLDVRLTTEADGGTDGVQIHLPDGAIVRFVRVADGWAAFGRRVRDIDVSDDGSAIVHVDDTTTLSFGHDGALVGWASGAATVLVERRDGRVHRISERLSGRSYEVAWAVPDGETESFVESITTDDGRKVDYLRDAAGRLTRAASAAGHLDYEWADGHLISVIDADGVRPFSNRYDEQGRVVHQIGEFGRATEYRYQPDGLTVIVGDDDVRQAMIHDGRGNLTAVVDVDGSAMRMEYDHLDRVVQVTSRAGAVTRYRYDEDDRLVERTDPDGLAISWTWDEHGRVTSRTLRDGGTTTFEFDGLLRSPSRIVDPTGAVTTAEIDPDLDEPVTITDADGVVTRLEYDRDGQAVAAIDGLGGRTEFSYDAAGRVRRFRDALGVDAQLFYDDAGRVVRSERAGAISTYERTPAGRIVAGTEPGGVAWSAQLGEHGAPVAIRDAMGAEMGLRYDAMGNRAAVITPDGAEFRSEYDAVGRLVAVVDPDGGVTAQTYDRDGRVAEVSDPSGRTTRRDVDVLGRTVQVEDAAGGVTRYGYHPNGEVAVTTDPTGRTWQSEIDAAGRTTAVINPNGGRSELRYSAAGRLLERLSPAGRVERFEYDAAGRPAVKIDAAGVRHVVERDAAGHILSSAGADSGLEVDWDDAGRVIGMSTPTSTAALEYDPAGRIAARTDGTGARSEYEWDARGLLVGATDPAGGDSTFGYDRRGRRTTQTDPAGRTTTWAYDHVGRLAGSVDPAGIATSYERDAAGFITAQHRGSAGWTRDLDAAARETRRVGSDGSLVGEFEYDAAGRVVAALGPDQWRTELLWDGDDLASITDPTGTTGIERDADGYVTTVTRPDGSRTAYQRDALGRVVSVGDSVAGRHDRSSIASETDRAGRLLLGPDGTVYRYDDAGRLIETSPPGGPARRLAYRSDGLIASERIGDRQREFSYDAAGRVAVIDVAGVGITSYEYDDAGRRSAEVRPDGTRVEFRWGGLERLVEITTVDRNGRRQAVSVGVDAFGRPVRVGGRPVQHDPVSGLPSQIGDVRVVNSTDETWRSDDAAWAPHRAGHAEGLTLGSLTFLGRRVLDGSTHQFLSPDPLLTAPGTNGASSAYTYAWQDPVNHVDPTGLRPISQEEWTQMRELEESGRLGQAWNAIKEDPWGSLAVGVMIAGAIVVGGPIGVGILIGAGVAAGAGLATGTFDPTQVLIGGALGGVGGAGASAGLSVGGQAALAGATGAVGDLGSQLVDGDPGPIDWWSVGVSGTVGAATSRIGGTQYIDDFASASARNAAIVGATTDGAGSIVQQALTGDHSISLTQVGIDAAGGGAGGYFNHQFSTANSAGVPEPQTLNGGPLMLEAGPALPALPSGPTPEMVTVYRGTSRTSEIGVHLDTGLMMSDAARQAYMATGDIDIAVHYSATAHDVAVGTWGSETDYVQAHAAFGQDITTVSGDRTMISVTTDPAVAEYFADKGIVYQAEVPADSLVTQTLPGAGESEYLARHAIEMTPVEPGSATP